MVAGSLLPAGLYGCASQPPDADTIDVARRHVLHALHRGLRFCQVGLFLVVAVGSWRADPAAVWLCKAVEVARLTGRALGLHGLETIHGARTEGPIAGLKKTLGWAGLELRGMRLCAGPNEGPCVMTDPR